MKKVCFLRSNGVAPDPRVEKEAKALVEAGYGVNVICWDRTGKLPLEGKLKFGDKYSVKVTRFSRKSGFGMGLRNLFPLLLFQYFLIVRLVRARKEIDVIHAADFDTILPAMLMKLLFRKKVVYDIYDFYVDAYNVPNALKSTIRRIDIGMIDWADAVIITTEKRVEQIAGSTPKQLVYLHNTPEPIGTTPALYSKADEREKKNEIVLSYVGVLQPGRLIEEVLSIVSRNPTITIKIAGFGPLESIVRTYSEKFDNIHFLGTVSYERSLEISLESDIMFATYDPRIANHKYSSPNKLYEAMMLSKPIIICGDTGIDEIVENRKLGMIIDYDEESFEKALLQLIENPDLRHAMARNAEQAYQTEFSWARMKLRLLEVYLSL